MSFRSYKLSQFTVGEQLGRGAFGVVYKGFDKVQRIDVAIKQVDLEGSDELQEIEQEIRMLSTCHDDHVTKYYGCFLKGHKLWIIMEYLGGGSCADLLEAGPFSESTIGQILAQLLEGLQYLHGNSKIHRDIKAANVLVGSAGEVKIGDFGVATQLSNNMSKRNTFVGTPYWMAPEIIKHKAYAFSADIWSLGITAIELAYGKPPLSQYHPFDVLFKITDEPSPTPGSNFSADFNEFVALCLNKDPLKRPTAAQLLKHKFIRRYAKLDKSSLTKLIEKKVAYDLETGNLENKKYYSPTKGESAGQNTMFDLGTLTIEETKEEEKAPVGTLKIVPQSNAKGPSSDQLGKEDESLKKELASILNQSFNKISQKYNLSTYEYDSLVRFETLLIDSFFLDQDSQYREVFAKFFKLVVKRVMRSENERLKDKVLPRYFSSMEHEWLEMLLKQREEESKNTRSRDEVEELLLTRWAENMLERRAV